MSHLAQCSPKKRPESADEKVVRTGSNLKLPQNREMKFRNSSEILSFYKKCNYLRSQPRLVENFKLLMALYSMLISFQGSWSQRCCVPWIFLERVQRWSMVKKKEENFISNRRVVLVHMEHWNSNFHQWKDSRNLASTENWFQNVKVWIFWSW